VSDNAMQEPPMSRAATLMTHSIPALLVASITARIGYFAGVPVIGSLDSLLSFAVLAWMFALYRHLRYGGLCLRCLRMSPLDPESSVRHWRPFLWMVHWSRGKFWGIYGICVITAFASDWADGWLKIALKLPLDIVFYSMTWAIWTHHRLAPWCPYCRGWDEGGDEELVPEPDPTEKATR
jgi:hypothetical protein